MRNADAPANDTCPSSLAQVTDRLAEREQPSSNMLAIEILIRPARSDEQATLESLQRRASLSNPGDREAILSNPDAIAVPVEQIAQGCVFVAERDGVVVGFAAVVPRPDGGAELDALFVEPHLWKHGVGRKLVDHAADVARVRAASFLHVIGNPHAGGFYTACGFRVDGTVDTRFGVGLAMRKSLYADGAPSNAHRLR